MINAGARTARHIQQIGTTTAPFAALSAHLVASDAQPSSCITAVRWWRPCRPGSSRKASANLAREGRFDYLLVESTGISEPLPAAEPHLGRRTVLTFPLLPPPQKN